MFLLVVMGGVWGLQFSMLKLATTHGYGELTVIFDEQHGASEWGAVALLLVALTFSVRENHSRRSIVSPGE